VHRLRFDVSKIEAFPSLNLAETGSGMARICCVAAGGVLHHLHAQSSAMSRFESSYPVSMPSFVCFVLPDICSSSDAACGKDRKEEKAKLPHFVTI
jgi:hypothetical protein